MVIKYHSQFRLMCFVYYIVRCSGAEHPDKRAMAKLRFHCRIKN